MDNNRVILHIDFNSFFATVEQQINPALRNKPVGIIKAKGRACVIAASVEAKKYGVSTGCDIFTAKKLCPSIILVPAEFDKYPDVTRRFIDICKSYTPVCEVFSLDECFLDVTDTEHLLGGVLAIAFGIKDRIVAEIGDYMKVSIGISHNRLLAKLASSQIKPDGLFLITDDNKLEVLDKSELMDICGLGWGLNRHLEKLGIKSFREVRSCSISFLKKNFGPYWSLHLYNVSRGVDKSPVVPYFEIADAKSVGRTYTTHRNLYKNEEVAQLVRNLCEEVCAKARQMGLVGRYVSISIRGGEDSKWGHVTLKNYIDDGKTFSNLCMKISKNWKFGYVRFCGVTLGMLTKKEYLPIPLFANDRKNQKLVKTIDTVNERYGDYTVFPGQLLGIPIIRPEVTGYFGDRKYQLSKLKTI